MSDVVNDKNFIELTDEMIRMIQTIYDPEIPVNIYELGLIYETKVDQEGIAHILMTLTTPNCPVAESLPQEVRDKVGSIEGINAVDLVLTFEPPWEMTMLSEAAKLELNL